MKTTSKKGLLMCTKHLRHLDVLRTARLRALSPDASPANNDPDANNDADPWGGTDEEVSKGSLSPNPKLKLTRRAARVGFMTVG